MPPETSDQKIERLEGELRQRDELIGELKRTVEEIRRELEEWKRGHRVRDRKRRGRRAKPPRAEGERRKAGREVGHEGAGRPNPTRVDRTVECRDEGACPCGGARSDVGIGRRHRVEELVISVEVTEYQCICQQCERCGVMTEGPLPPELGGAPKVGPHAQAVAMALRFDAGMPVCAISRVFKEIFGLPFSPGGLSQMFERNMTKFEPANVEVRNEILEQSLVYADETGWWMDGRRSWLFAVTTPDMSVFWTSPHRDRATFQQIVPADYAGFVATDAYSVYDSLPELRHPQCWGHVVRTARDLSEIHGDAGDVAFRESINAFVAAAKAHRAVEWPSGDTRTEAIALFEAAIVASSAAEHPKLQKLGRRLDRKRIRYLLCLDDKAVPMTTNQVERDLRGHIAVRKLSFGSRNPLGCLQWSQGTTLNQTLRKQGSRLVDYVPRALAEVTRDGTMPSVFAPSD